MLAAYMIVNGVASVTAIIVQMCTFIIHESFKLPLVCIRLDYTTERNLMLSVLLA